MARTMEGQSGLWLCSASGHLFLTIALASLLWTSLPNGSPSMQGCSSCIYELSSNYWAHNWGAMDTKDNCSDILLWGNIELAVVSWCAHVRSLTFLETGSRQTRARHCRSLSTTTLLNRVSTSHFAVSKTMVATVVPIWNSGNIDHSVHLRGGTIVGRKYKNIFLIMVLNHFAAVSIFQTFR
jgi:hypothetical protein